jgi:hypothetical protein
MLPLGGPHVKHTVQCGIWAPMQHPLWDQGKPRKPQLSWLVAGPSRHKPTSSQQSGIKYMTPNTSPHLCYFFSFPLWKHLQVALTKFHLYITWINTKPCITPTERTNAYMHKRAHNHTYICNRDSLTIDKFGSSLHFATKKKRLLYEVCRSSNNKDHAWQPNSFIPPSVKSSNIDKYRSFDLSLSQQTHHSCSIIPHQTSEHFLLSHHTLFITPHSPCISYSPALWSEVEVKVTLPLTVGQSVSMSRYQVHSGTCDQILLSVRRLFSESCCLVSVGRPLWRQVGSVICRSL